MSLFCPKFANGYQLFEYPTVHTAEGITNLNKSRKQETGYFIAEASTDGKTVISKSRKSYNKAFEPASNWEKLLAFIDAANEWANAKILFKKKMIAAQFKP